MTIKEKILIDKMARLEMQLREEIEENEIIRWYEHMIVNYQKKLGEG